MKNPVDSLVREISKKDLWQPGDAVFTSTGWSHLVFILGPRTLNETFDFKNALQGLPEVDRTQSTFGTLFQKRLNHLPLDGKFGFRTMLRVGDISGDQFNELQTELAGLSHDIGKVEEVPGIFDLQLTWNKVPSFEAMLDIIEIGNRLADSNHTPDNPQKKPGSLISDLQTSVTRKLT